MWILLYQEYATLQCHVDVLFGITQKRTGKKYFVPVYRYLFLFQWGNIMSHLHYSCVILLQQILTRTQIARKYCCNNKCCWCFSRSWFLLPCCSSPGIHISFWNIARSAGISSFLTLIFFCGSSVHPFLKAFQHMLIQSCHSYHLAKGWNSIPFGQCLKSSHEHWEINAKHLLFYQDLLLQ